MAQNTLGTYIVVDLEMTGLSPFEHGVIEVGAIVMNDAFDIIGEFLMDLCPPKDVTIDPDSLIYNGFTLDRIAKGKSYEVFCDAWKSFLDIYFPDGKKPIMIGQFIAADLAFLGNVFHRTGRNELSTQLGNDIIDTKSIANEANAIARYHGTTLPFQSTSLSKPNGISETLHLSEYKAHTAKGDIMATREALMKFLKFKV